LNVFFPNITFFLDIPINVLTAISPEIFYISLIILILSLFTLFWFFISSIASFITPLITGTLFIKLSKLKAWARMFLPYLHEETSAKKIPLDTNWSPKIKFFCNLRELCSIISLVNFSPIGRMKNSDREFVKITFNSGFYSANFLTHVQLSLYLFSLLTRWMNKPRIGKYANFAYFPYLIL